MADFTCFLIIPFSKQFDRVYQSIRRVISRSIPGKAIRCIHLKEVRSAGRITDDIVEGISKSTFCLADVSTSNPNVMWETGYAMAAGKPTILIKQAGTRLPFDLTVHRVHQYSKDLKDLRRTLPDAVRQTLAKFDLPGGDLPNGSTEPSRLTIAITGSMQANVARLNVCLESLIKPYLGGENLWLTGSHGTSDESIVKYLLKQQQRVEVVGYNEYDISPTIRQFVTSGKTRFVAGSNQPVPSGLEGPSRRDEFFCAKADLIILLWDGKSSGTSALHQYFTSRRKCVLVAFV